MASSISITQIGGIGIAVPRLTISKIFQVNTGTGRTGAIADAVHAAAGAEG
jgi:hypothetical protein